MLKANSSAEKQEQQPPEHQANITMLKKSASNVSCNHGADASWSMLRHSITFPVGGAQDYVYGSCILWNESQLYFLLAPSVEALQSLY